MSSLTDNPLLDGDAETPESQHRTRGKDITIIPSSTNGVKWTWKQVTEEKNFGRFVGVAVLLTLALTSILAILTVVLIELLQ